MKIRTGFVSNSSSSAFITIIQREEFDKKYELLDKIEKQIIDYFYHPDTVIGMDVMIYSEGENSTPTDNFDYKNIFIENNIDLNSEEYFNYTYNTHSKFIKSIDDDLMFSHSVDY